MRTPCRVILLLFFLAPFVTTAPVLAQDAQRPSLEYFPMPGDQSLPFSEAVRVGNILFVSGQVGVRPGTTTLVAGGFEAEARQALANVKAALERHGSSMNAVAKCTVFLADIKDWPRFNTIYREFFSPGHMPARSALGANGLAIDARVEVECIGVVGG
jgi:2-iminobutanoate/2-iminopropanoate deaminase